MTVSVFGSAKGAPGVTATVLALAWAWPTATGRRVLVVDADMAGSGILPGYLHANPPVGDGPVGGGLLEVCTTRDSALTTALLASTTALDTTGDRLLLAGVSDPGQARALDAVWTRLGAACVGLGADGIDVLVDTGRIGTRHEVGPLVDAAGPRVLVLRAHLGAVAAARPALHAWSGGNDRVRLLVVGPGRPYTAEEIRGALDADAGGLDTIAWDPAAAAVFAEGARPGWRLSRSPLLRSARALAQHLHAAAAGRVGVGS